MIGDDVRDDVEGAQGLGITGILVKTGKYQPGNETRINTSPNFIVSSFAEAVDLILSNGI